MKVIFLDIDGVLNCEQTTLDRFYKLENNLPLGEFYYMQAKLEGLDLYRGIYLDIDENKVQILGEIVKQTGAKIVLSSSHRADWKDGKDNLQFARSKALQYLFDKYGIDVIGITPYINKQVFGWREDEIKEFLKYHDVESFCIFDDDVEDLQTLKEYLIKTEFYENEIDEGGLQTRHINEAVKILSKVKKYKRQEGF